MNCILKQIQTVHKQFQKSNKKNNTMVQKLYGYMDMVNRYMSLRVSEGKGGGKFPLICIVYTPYKVCPREDASEKNDCVL